MQRLELNQETGYLESRTFTDCIFDSAKKIKFLQIARQSVKKRELPEVHLIAEAVGTSVGSFYDHVRKDAKFAAEWREIQLEVNSILEKELYSKAMSKIGVVANLAWLKRIESGSWLDQSRIIHSNDPVGLKDLNSKYLDALDAEIVPETKITSTPPKQIESNSQSTT